MPEDSIKPKRNKFVHKRNYQDKTRYYVTNDALYKELCKYRESSKENGTKQISEELGKMLYTIAKHLTYHWSFKNYPEYLKEDMISFACYKMIKYIDSYNLDRKPQNPFSYFTQICYNAFLGPINDYYRQKNLKRDITLKTIDEIQMSKFSTIKSTYMNQIQRSLEEFLQELEKESIKESETEENKNTVDNSS